MGMEGGRPQGINDDKGKPKNILTEKMLVLLPSSSSKFLDYLYSWMKRGAELSADHHLAVIRIR